jgi:hypothetical protein
MAYDLTLPSKLSIFYNSFSRVSNGAFPVTFATEVGVISILNDFPAIIFLPFNPLYLLIHEHFVALL